MKLYTLLEYLIAGKTLIKYQMDYKREPLRTPFLLFYNSISQIPALFSSSTRAALCWKRVSMYCDCTSA